MPARPNEQKCPDCGKPLRGTYEVCYTCAAARRAKAHLRDKFALRALPSVIDHFPHFVGETVRSNRGIANTVWAIAEAMLATRPTK